MPIDFFDAPDGVHVRQSFDSPTVYLDHSAIRSFSDDLCLQNRFVNALLSKRGTLLLSNISLGEFAKAEDPRHCMDAEHFIERLLPNLFLTDFALDKVHEQELAEQNNLKRFWPSADLPQLKLFAERAQDTPHGFSMKGFISMAHSNRTGFSQIINETVQSIIDGHDSIRKAPDYIRKAKSVMPSDYRTRTFVIFGELLRGFTLDSSASISENDVIDFLHAVMPINCCDYVLLDGPWVERVNKMIHRIQKTGMIMPIAKCSSKRDNGIDSFLTDLEAFQPLR
ncbi:MAG: hypothetical protein HY014_10835 [Acidobacteria bacterium]|nr:hypothetical protein [Acidobacteriota bacterium]MBI3488650.1 hypothetical protein [Acidobacteriota bacterium]